jgi:hypothetical protein
MDAVITRERQERRKVTAAAAALALFAALGAANGCWAGPAALVVVAAALWSGSRAARGLVFAVSASLGVFLALGLMRWSLRRLGAAGPPPPAVDEAWVVYFAALGLVYLSLAGLTSPSRPRVSPASPAP